MKIINYTKNVFYTNLGRRSFSTSIRNLCNNSKSEICDKIPCTLKINKEKVYPHYKIPINDIKRLQMNISREEQITIFEREGFVIRPLEKWSYQVHEFLRNIRNQGFFYAPKPIEIDVYNQIEKVSYIKGSVVNYPLTKKASSIEVLKSAAHMLRKYHDSTIEYVKSKSYDNSLWQLPKQDPIEVICHGDYAPYNVVLDDINVIGMIDFDTCHPGPRSWDLAYALYRWSPLNNPDNQDGFGNLIDQASRARTFCDVYGYKREDRVELPNIIITRLEALINFMENEANSGNITYAQNINEGHAKLYADDIIYISNNKQFFIDSLTKKADFV